MLVRGERMRKSEELSRRGKEMRDVRGEEEEQR